MSRRSHIVIDDAIPFIEGVLEPYFQVSYMPGIDIRRQDIKNADALVVRTRTLCNASLLEQTPVRFVVTATIGTDHFDIPFLNEHGIHWMHAPGCNAGSVCQYVLAAIFEVLNQTKKPLAETTLGIVGVGHIGSRLYELVKALGIRCLLCDPPLSDQNQRNDFLPLEEILQQSDIVSLHVPLTETGFYPTKHLISHSQIEKMASHAFLINSSRGPVVDNQALSFHLKEKRISGAILDVWEEEPNINTTLLSQVMIGTPHIAGYSQDGKANATTQVVRGLGHFFEIEPLKNFSLELESKTLDIEPEVEDDVQFLRSIYKKIYDIERDSLLLKNAPLLFESFRKNYPIRREAKAYKIKTTIKNQSRRIILQKLGFNLFVDE